MTRVLITGGTGFVGANVVRRFAEGGTAVVALDRAAPDAALRRYLGPSIARVTFVQADVTDEQWHRALPPEAVDTVIHAAAITNTGDDEEAERASRAVAVNVLGAVNVAAWAAGRGVARYVHVSSGSVYGRAVEGGAPLDETLPAGANSVYSLTKYAAEQLVRRLAQLRGLPLVVVRLPSQYGPMERNTHDRTRLSVLQAWCGAAARGEEVVVALPQFARDYTYVRDVADALYCLAGAPALGHDLYNVSSGIAVPPEAVLDVLRELFPALRVRYVENTRLNPSDRKPFAVERLRADVGWTPRFTLRDAIADYVAWLQSEPDAGQARSAT